jgi:steroid 5-alpha reductase family enzyme
MVIEYLILLAAILFLYMSLWFIVSVLIKRNDIADIAWGLGFVLLAWTSFFLSESNGLRGLLLCILVSIWGLRLSWHIYLRNKNRPEDYRYAKWRQDWGKWFYLRSYLQVYLLQGILLFIIVSPVLLANYSLGKPFGILDVVGILIWLVGFVFESVGDAQLAEFIKDPNNKGKLLQTGLWQYTRHPNYFGEVTQWWGIWLSALSTPAGFLTVIGPLMITFLILKVSGVPMLEKKMSEHPDFESYKKRTNMFIPWKPNKV